jgi:hypothetical protein
VAAGSELCGAAPLVQKDSKLAGFGPLLLLGRADKEHK